MSETLPFFGTPDLYEKYGRLTNCPTQGQLKAVVSVMEGRAISREVEEAIVAVADRYQGDLQQMVQSWNAVADTKDGQYLTSLTSASLVQLIAMSQGDPSTFECRTDMLRVCTHAVMMFDKLLQATP